jgi:hypothetical protein
VSANEKVDDLLKESGAELIRDKKHLVYRLPGGATFVRSATPSDRKEGRAALSSLRHALGLVGERRG